MCNSEAPDNNILSEPGTKDLDSVSESDDTVLSLSEFSASDVSVGDALAPVFRFSFLSLYNDSPLSEDARSIISMMVDTPGDIGDLLAIIFFPSAFL